MILYVCEDDLKERLWLTTCHENELKELNMDIPIESEGRPEKVLATLPDHPGPNIYFLDIQLNAAVDGIELARRIREVDPLGYIVYVSIREDRAFETITSMTMPTGFLSKEFMFDAEKFTPQLRQILVTIQDHLNQVHPNQPAYLEIKNGGFLIRLRQDDLLYIEKVRRLKKVTVVTTNNRYEVNGSIHELASHLTADNFFNGFQSYILNTEHIQTVNFTLGHVTMSNGDELNFSRGTIKKLRDFIREK